MLIELCFVERARIIETFAKMSKLHRSARVPAIERYNENNFISVYILHESIGIQML